MHNSLLDLLLKNCDFLNTDISQGSVATHLVFGGVFKYSFVINFLLSLTVKEFWKSINIWWSYGQEFGVLFFWDTVYVTYMKPETMASWLFAILSGSWLYLLTLLTDLVYNDTIICHSGPYSLPFCWHLFSCFHAYRKPVAASIKLLTMAVV